MSWISIQTYIYYHKKLQQIWVELAFKPTFIIIKNYNKYELN